MYTLVCTHTCTHSAHTCTHSCMHTFSHMHTCMCTHIYTHTCMHTHMHMHAHAHTRTHMCVHTLTHSHTHTHSHNREGEIEPVLCALFFSFSSSKPSAYCLPFRFRADHFLHSSLTHTLISANTVTDTPRSMLSQFPSCLQS